MVKRLLATIMLLCGTVLAQAPWPGQSGNPVGYGAYGSGTPGGSACGTIASGSAGAPTIISNCTITGSTTISASFVRFVQVTFIAGTGGVNISGSNDTFIGSWFQSNQVGFYNVQVSGANIVFTYCSFTPLASLYTSPPGLVWPSAGSGANTTTQTTDVNAVNGNSGYQYGVLVVDGAGATTIDHSDVWGFGNSIDYCNGSCGSITAAAKQIVTNSWVHDAANASPQGYHTDGPGYLNGSGGPNHVWLIGNTIASLGNTNGLAMQAATSGYSDMQTISNYFSGFGYTLSPGDIGTAHFTNSALFGNVLGTDVEPVFGNGHGYTLGTNSVWACNTIAYRSGTTWSVAGWTPVSGNNGKYWVESNSAPASSTDQGGNTICPALAPSSSVFLNQPISTTSAGKTITLTNSGSASITSLSVALQTGTKFSISSNTCGSTLTAGSTCTVAVTYSPTAIGVDSDNLQFTDNAPAPSSPQNVPLLGLSVANTGAATQPSCTPGTGAYGSNQTVACNNPNSGTTVMCYTTNGATPATNGLGTACTTGTIYTAPFSVSTLTLKVIAGSSTLTDSTVASYGYTITVATPALPLLWVNNNECNSNYTYVLTFPGTWVSATPASWPTVLPYANTAAGVQQAILDMEAYRTSTGSGTRMHIPAGFLYSAANGPYIPQTSTVAATQCNIIDSSDDALLPNGVTVGSHGIQDNLATSTDPGLHNPSGDGLNMYDEAGPQNVGGVITGITTLSSHTTTLAAITLNASAQLVPLANSYVSPGNSYVVDTGGNAETVVATSGVNQTGIFGVFTKNHASGVSVTYDVGTITLANGTVVTTASFNDVQHLYTFESTGANGVALRFCAPVGGGATSSAVPACGSGTLAPDHWLIMDMEARPAAVFVNGSSPTPVQMSGSGSETFGSQYPQHIHFRKDWVHSDFISLAAGLNPPGNFMFLNGSYISVLDTQTSQGIRPGTESHNILLEGVGPYKLSHNWLEGEGIGMFSGGPAGNVTLGLQQIFQDVEARRNRETRPYWWLSGTLASNPHFAGQSLVLKNLNEIKNGQRILHDGFIWEHTDGSGGQSGPFGDVNDRNCSVSTCSNYNTIIQDLILSNGIQRSGCEGMEWSRSNIGAGNGGGIAYGIYRSTLRNMLTYSASGHNPGCSIANDISGIRLDNGSRTQFQGTVTGNGTTATFVANCSTNQQGCPGQISSIAVNAAGTGCVAGNLVIPAPNISGGQQASGTYTCSGGALSTVTLATVGTGYTSAPSVTLTTGTGTVTVTMHGAATPPAIGTEALDMLAGDPVAITMCSVTTAFNNVTTANIGGKIVPNQRGPLATTGSTPWNGTPAAGNLTVSFPSTITGTDTGGFCTLNAIQGGPFNWTIQHVTQITDNGGPALTSANNPSTGFNFQMNAGLVDSILLDGTGWVGGSVTEGTQTENMNYDATTMSAHHLVLPTRNAANYTEYCNNALYPNGAAGCTGSGLHAPVTIYTPTTSHCTGASATSACVGFTGAMSASSMPITLPDYHNFALVSSSLFKAGGTQQASDGTDMGANISAIDAAQTLNQYVCATACGSGPFPDVVQSASAPCVACMISKADVPGILEAAPESFWNSSLRLK